MKHIYNLVSSKILLLIAALGIGFAAPAQAQNEDFSPFRGTCWGLFYDQEAQYLVNTMIPIKYDRPTWDKYILRNFLDTGRDLIVHITNEALNEGYYDIELEMDGGLYDDYGYFYPPFNALNYKYTFTAPNGELIGPILQPYSYYHDEFEYLGMFYVRYPQQEFGYFDVKFSEDYYETEPREYYDPDEEDTADGISQISASENLDNTYYNLAGRRADAHSKGIVITNGRKEIR